MLHPIQCSRIPSSWIWARWCRAWPVLEGRRTVCRSPKASVSRSVALADEKRQGGQDRRCAVEWGQVSAGTWFGCDLGHYELHQHFKPVGADWGGAFGEEGGREGSH